MTAPIAIICYCYAIEVSPVLKNICGYLGELSGHAVDVYVDKLYRQQGVEIPGANIVDLEQEIAQRSTAPGHENDIFAGILSERVKGYDVVFAVEFESFALLGRAGADLTRIVFLSFEGVDYMNRYPRELVKAGLRECMFSVVQSPEREATINEYLGEELAFEYLPVSNRRIRVRNRAGNGALKILYSGYLADWACLDEFLTAYAQSRSYEFSSFTMHGHCMGTEVYAQQISRMAAAIPNTAMDGSFYDDRSYPDMLTGFNVGLALYKDLSGTGNFDNLIFSSGKISTYLWCGLAVITNVRSELTLSPPFVYLPEITPEALRSAMLKIYDSLDVYGKAARKLAEERYNFDTYMEPIARRLGIKKTVTSASATNTLEALRAGGLWQEGATLRLHLGCGEQHFDGYVNIDYPPSEHNVMQTRADFHADLRDITFPAESVDEIRLHHVFEHFNRAVALAMLIRWHRWLKTGGILVIETPDLEGSAKIVLSDLPWNVKAATVRHLAGDQAASWGYHIEHWFPERFRRTLQQLGFGNVEITSSHWPHEPFLANVTAVAVKIRPLPHDELLQAADQILRESLVNSSEAATFEVWKKQLRAALAGETGPGQPLFDVGKILPPIADIPSPSLAEVHDFNQRSRDRWVKEKALSVSSGSRVLDIGAGTCPYRQLFSHCDYKAHDFKKYDGIKLGGTTEYGELDFISDIAAISAPDESFDVIICTEVLEHVPEPFRAVEEMARLLKPEGRLLITAPLGSGLHQLPFHYYGGFTPEWYKLAATRLNLDVVEILPNGGFFKLLAQECARVAWTFQQHANLHGDNGREVFRLFNETLPSYLYRLDEQCFIDQFTVGYHVEMTKPAGPTEQTRLLDRLDEDHGHVPALVRLAVIALEHANLPKARRYVTAALALSPRDPEAIELWHRLQGARGTR